MKRTFGELKYDSSLDKWVVVAEPHVRMRFKDLFRRVSRTTHGDLRISDSPQVCKDLMWFMERYPLELALRDKHLLERGVLKYDQREEDLERILLPDYVPRQIELKKPLRKYQGQLVDLFLRSRKLLCGDDTGLGKTAEWIGALIGDPGTRPSLVVCQTHLPVQWAEEIVKFAPELKWYIVKKRRAYSLPPADVYIMSYSKLSGWNDTFRKGFFKSVCFDECQEIRCRGSDKYRSARIVASNAQFVMGMSATPIYNYGDETWNVMNVLSPDCLGDFDEFKREWCNEMGHSGKYKVREPAALGSYLKENYLMIRRTRVEVGRELPPVNKVVHTIEYSEKKVENMRTRLEQIAARVVHGGFVERGQAARELDVQARMLTGIGKADSVAAYVSMLCENGEKVLLCGWHREVYRSWLKHLEHYNPVMYTGSETPGQKERSKKAFIQGNAQVMIMSLRSGVGIDGLQKSCSLVVFGEMDWSPGVHKQIIGRLRRDGQDDQVTAIYLVSDGGTDPLMVELLGLKSSQADGIMNPDGQNDMFAQSDENRIKRLATQILEKRVKV